MRGYGRCGRWWVHRPTRKSGARLVRCSMSMRPQLALTFVCCLMVAGCGLSGTSTAGTAAGGSPLPTLTHTPAAATRTPTTEGTAAGGSPLPTLTLTPAAATRAPTPALTALPDRAESDCAGFTNRPALALVSYPEPYQADSRSLALITPDGRERCTVVPPYIGHYFDMQLVGERVYHWAETIQALQVVDVSSGELTFVQPELDPALAFHWEFQVSPGGERIAWLVSDGMGTRHALYVTQADSSEPRRVLEYSEYVEYAGGGGGRWYSLRLVGWTAAGDSLWFARQPPGEGGGIVLPQLRGRYVSLYQVDVDTGVETTVISLEEDCSACVADVSADGRWMAYFLETGRLCLRDLGSGEETLIEGDGWLCCARFSPDSSHLVYVEFEGHTGGGGERFTRSRTVMVSVPDAGDTEVIADEAWSMWNRPAGWLDGETPILERIDGARSPAGYLWIAGSDPLENRFPDCGQVGVLRD